MMPDSVSSADTFPTISPTETRPLSARIGWGLGDENGHNSLSVMSRSAAVTVSTAAISIFRYDPGR